VDLVAQSNVIDMLGLLTLDWPLLDRWHRDPANFTDSDFQKLRSSGIDVFHPAVAFETAQSYEVTRAWFEKWNRLIARHADYFLRVDGPNDLARAKQEGRIGIILGMQDANHLRCVDDVDAFYRMGQRLTQLTYNSANELGNGCKVGLDKGLTAFGLQVVERMNAIGMAIDVSHCGQRRSAFAHGTQSRATVLRNRRRAGHGEPRSHCPTSPGSAGAARIHNAPGSANGPPVPVTEGRSRNRAVVRLRLAEPRSRGGTAR
jgi:membrane dipeptidase